MKKAGHLMLFGTTAFVLLFFSVESLLPITKTISFTAVGDIMLSRTVEQKMIAKKDLSYPFSQTRDYLKKQDIVFGNVESPIINGRLIKTGEFTFRAPEASANELQESGFDVVSLANNHIMNFGQKGLQTTLTKLQEVNIQASGIGTVETVYAPQYIEQDGITIAILSFASKKFHTDITELQNTLLGVALMDIKKMTSAVQEATKKADFVIVSMHAGTEYVTKPTKEQTEFAQKAIDAGADMVLGHHPHVIQEMEEYNGKPIFYSLGNFIFDQMWSKKTREGLVINAKLSKQGIEHITCRGVRIQDYAVPGFVSAEETESWVKPLDPQSVCDTFE